MAPGALGAPALLFRLKYDVSHQRGLQVSLVKEGPENNCFSLCGPHPPVAATRLFSRGQKAAEDNSNKSAWPCDNKTLLTKPGCGLDVALGP